MSSIAHRVFAIAMTLFGSKKSVSQATQDFYQALKLDGSLQAIKLSHRHNMSPFEAIAQYYLKQFLYKMISQNILVPSSL